MNQMNDMDKEFDFAFHIKKVNKNIRRNQLKVSKMYTTVDPLQVNTYHLKYNN